MIQSLDFLKHFTVRYDVLPEDRRC